MKARFPILALLLACGCTTPEVSDSASGPITYRDNAYATRFRIGERGVEKLLVVLGPGGAHDTIGVYGKSPQGLAFPLKRIAVASTTHLAYIAALGASDAVAGAAHLGRMHHADRWRHRDPPVEEIGTAAGIDRELLLRLGPQALLDHPFGRKDPGLETAGVPVVQITEYLEEHPLGRAEWLRFFGVLLGVEARADSLFRTIAGRYTDLIVRDDLQRPTVFFGSSWQDRWHAPSGDSYMATLIHHAGGAYVLAETGSENIALDREVVLHHALKVDRFGQVVAHAGVVDASIVAGGDTRIAKAIASRRSGFHANSMMSDLFGQALLEPDTVLLDLCRILHPERLQGHRPKYFHALAQ
ncbi:MAG: ABC transporter substrate-binding protein [Flavobacteriales bacterium]|nr:ABC transporter substrate-binding protein [Flavobacteriales bacterium]